MQSGSTWIVFLTPMTTSHSKVALENPGAIPFWHVLFDSFLAKSYDSLHDESDPYYYSFFIGYDVGDTILDTEDGVRWIVNELHCRLDHAGIGTLIQHRAPYIVYVASFFTTNSHRTT
jgi:hypothetical protein